MEKNETSSPENFQNQNSRELLSNLSIPSFPSGMTEEESSLSIVDLDALPDAQRSVSFVHVENKSSLGSFLDHCFSSADDQKSEDSQVPNVQKPPRSKILDDTFGSSIQCSELQSSGPSQPLNEVPFLQNLKSPFAEGSDDSNNSEFDFNADELDIDILINEDDENMDNTLVKHDQATNGEKLQSQSKNKTDPDKHSTTFEFLKGLGLAGSPNKSSQLPPMDISRQGDGSYTAAYIDSLYFAPGSEPPTPLYSDTKSQLYDETSMFGKQTISKIMDDDFGQDVSDGRTTPQSSSTMRKDPFDDMVCGNPLNFTGFEFQNSNAMSSAMFADDQFASADDAKKLLDKDEENFEKENRFFLNENFVAANDESGLRDFSTYRMPNMSVQEEDEAGKISIGTYMAKRSDKLGGLEADNSAERPSFGMKVRSPSPQKPCQLVGSSSLSTVDENSSNHDGSKSDPDSSDSNVSSVINLSATKFGETIDQSLMNSISKAISNMSSTMSNEDLAQFIIALSNKKMDLEKQVRLSKIEDSILATAGDCSSVPPAGQSTPHTQAGVDPEEVMDSTLKNEETTLQEETIHHHDAAISEVDDDAHTSITPPPQEIKTPSLSSDGGKAEDDDLASLPGNETTFSPSSSDQRVLSSTRANLSLTRGSLSRESIEKLHRQLRSHGDGASRETALPDVVSDQSNHVHSAIVNSSMRDSTQPLSHSSPSSISHSSPDNVKSSDLTLTRLSAAFQKLHPSHSFEELATIAESQVNEEQLPEVFYEDNKKEEEKITPRTTVNTRDELPSCESVDTLPKASSTRTSSRSRFSSCSSDVAKQSVDQSLSSQVTSQSTTSNKPFSSSYPHCLPSNLIPSFATHLPQEAQLFPAVHSSLAFLPPVSQMGRPVSAVKSNFDSTLYGSASTTGYVYPYQPVAAPSRNVYHDAPYYDDILPCIVTPNDLRFDSSLCVGVPSKILLPLKNTGSRWVQVQLRCLSITIDQKIAPLNHESYVCLKQKHVVGPHSKEDTDVAVIGHEAGKYHIVIEVISTLICMEGSRAAGQRCNVSTLSVIANVDLPSVSLYGTYELPSDVIQKRLIDFGEVVLGSSKSLPLRILNKGKVEVPLRINLLTPSHDGSFFSLSLSSSAVQQDQNNLSSLATLRTVLTVSDQPYTVWVHFNSSTRRSLLDEKPLKLENRIEAVLDAPFRSVESSLNLSRVETVLDSIALTALVGIGKLHAPRSLQMLTFTASSGSLDMKKIPVKNAGNITVQVSFNLEDQSGLFTLRPTSAVLPPGDDVQLSVEFQPLSSAPVTSQNNPLTNLIYMNILPSGPQFEVQIRGIVTSSSSDPVSPLQPTPPSLLTNKNRLRWGGVPVGKSQKQKLMLRTVTTTTAIKFRCSLKSDSFSSFQILSSCNGYEELVRNSIMAVVPGHDQAVSVIFTPCRKQLVHAKLEIKTPIEELPATKYTIPLSGYGGSSQIRVEGLDRSSISGSPLHNEYVPELYTMKSEDMLNEIKVFNCGSRSAFVKLVAYSDSSLERISSSVLCSPSQFILDERQFRVISIRCTTSAAAASTFYVCIWHGDELSRVLMRKALSAHPSASSLIARCIPQSHSYLRTISFDGIFDKEDQWKEENLQDVEPHSYDVQIFYQNIKQTLVEIKPEMRQIGPSSGNTTTNLSCQDLPVKDVGLQQEIKHAIMPAAPLPDLAPSSFSLNWSITPTHITLTLPSNPGQSLPEPTRVKIKNRSLASLIYDVVWPGHYVTITPQRGRVEPESVGILLVSPNPSLASSQSLLPWCGQAMVLATGGSSWGAENSCIIHIQIKEIALSSDMSSKTDETSSDDVISEADTIPSIPKLQVLTNPLEFPSVAIGNNAKSQLEFRNLSKNSIKWLLSSVAPPYVKNSTPSNSGSIFRSTYAAFVFSHRSGSLEPGARVQIPVSFNPMNVGFYSQHWEIEYHDANDVAALTLQTEKIQLSGKGASPLHNNQSVSRKSEVRHDIYVTESCYWFPDTPVNKSSMIKIPIKNKAKVSRTVKFINLRPPFYITHQKHAIRSMCCANLPVTFKATQKGAYSDVLVIQSEGNPDVRITLKAKAVAN